LHRSILLIVAAALAFAAPARAADPIMPLAEVRSGMLCISPKSQRIRFSITYPP
jgi:hypothetical protein